MVGIQLQQFEVQPGQTLLLRDINWPKFEAILAELGEHRGTRVAYDNGWLEIMAPLPEHEYVKQSISIAIEDIAEALNLDYESYGSTTWRQQAKQAGVEADNCFYVQNEARIRGKLEINLTCDPPPDLALEIDLTHKSLERLPIYARLGVPEIWCYDSDILKLYQLQGNQYIEAEQNIEAELSQVFPALAIRELPQLIQTYRPQGRLDVRRAVRDWVKQQAG